MANISYGGAATPSETKMGLSYKPRPLHSSGCDITSNDHLFQQQQCNIQNRLLSKQLRKLEFCCSKACLKIIPFISYFPCRSMIIPFCRPIPATLSITYEGCLTVLKWQWNIIRRIITAIIGISPCA